MALHIERNLNESVVVNGELRITVTKIRRGKAWLAFDGPRSYAVWREEIAAAAEPSRGEADEEIEPEVGGRDDDDEAADAT